METINITLPTSWQELTPKQVRYVYFLLSEGYSADAVKTFCLCRWTGLEVIEPYGDGYTIRYQKNLYHLTASKLAACLHHLAWLDTVPSVPIRLELAGRQAPAADLAGVTFAQYMTCDNLYMGYLHTQNTELLQEMVCVLYDDETITCSNAERIAMFYWFASVKSLFGRLFPHLFTTASTLEIGDMEKKLRDQMNAEIRALTKGDITKEEAVMNMDVHRALTELDAQAEDYEEMKKWSGSTPN